MWGAAVDIFYCIKDAASVCNAFPLETMAEGVPLSAPDTVVVRALPVQPNALYSLRFTPDVSMHVCVKLSVWLYAAGRAPLSH